MTLDSFLDLLGKLLLAGMGLSCLVLLPFWVWWMIGGTVRSKK